MNALIPVPYFDLYTKDLDWNPVHADAFLCVFSSLDVFEQVDW